MKYEIVELSKEIWQGTELPNPYMTNEVYDVKLRQTDKGFQIAIEKEALPAPGSHYPEEYDYPDKLYQDYFDEALAWGVIIDGELIAALETAVETWSKRLRVTELWVKEEYRRKGLGHALMEKAKARLFQENFRVLILETQSCNVNAIEFYLHEGFTLIGFDSCCYRNNDIERKEVRLEFGWFPEIIKGEE